MTRFLGNKGKEKGLMKATGKAREKSSEK